MTDTSPVFRPLLSAAWRSTWKYPWLFGFGFFASFLSIGGFWEILTNVRQTSATSARIAATLAAFATDGALGDALRGLGRTAREAPGSLLALILIFAALLCIVALLLFLASSAHAAIVDTAAKTQKARRTTFRAEWAVGRRFAPRVLAIHLTLKIAVGALLLAAGFAIAATAGADGSAAIVALIVFVALIAASLVATLLSMYAVTYAVMRGYTWREAIRASLRLFLAHWLVSLELATVFFLISIAIGLCAFAALLLLSVPLVFLMMIAQVLVLPWGMHFLLAAWLVLLFAILAATAALATSWQTAAWTLLFVRLTEGDATPKLVRLFRRSRNT